MQRLVSFKRLRPGAAAALALSLALLPASVPASPAVWHADYSFSTEPNASMWGSGTGYSFGTNGQVGGSSLNFGYDFGASSGTLSSTIAGMLSVGYDTRRLYPGTLPLSVGFTGAPGGGSLASDFGARAQVWATLIGRFDLVDYGLRVNPSTTFTPQLGQTYTATDSDAIAGVDVGISSLINAGVNLSLALTDSLRLDSITGHIVASHDGLQQVLPFSIGGTTPTNLQPYLSEVGVWNFWVNDLQLNATFNPSFDVDLVFYETHPNGIRWCSRRVWGFTFSWPCGLTTGTDQWVPASFNVYNGSPFGLDYSDAGRGTYFSVYVADEPPPAAMLGLGLVIMAWVSRAGRRRRRAPGA